MGRHAGEEKGWGGAVGGDGTERLASTLGRGVEGGQGEVDFALLTSRTSRRARAGTRARNPHAPNHHDSILLLLRVQAPQPQHETLWLTTKGT